MFSKIKKQIHLFIYTLKILWSFNKKGLLEVFFLAFISGIYPIITLVLTQDIMNAIQKMEKTFNELVQMMFCYGGIVLVGIIVSGLNTYCMNKLSIKLMYHMNYMLIKKCGELSLEDLEHTETYDKISRLENEISIKPYQSLQAIIGFVSVFVTFISASSIIFAWKPWLFWGILIGSLIIFMFNIKIGNSEFLIKFQRSDSERRAWYCSYLLTHDIAFKEIKANGLQEFLLGKYVKLCKRFIHEDNRINRLKILLNVVLAVLEDMIAVAVMYLSIKEAYVGILLIGTAMTFMNASTMIQSSTSALSGHIYNIYNSNLYMQLLEDFMELNKNDKEVKKMKLGSIENISFSHVGFDYFSRNGVLKDITFEVKRGQCIAIIGKNGSGKTTLLKLLGALYSHKDGNIEYNGINENMLNTEEIRKQISVLFQDYLKYEGTVRENIVMNQMEEKEHIEQTLNSSNADFLKENNVYNLDKNLGTWFENGVQLSGGQWQKVALSRTFYKKASVYIFDEPSAALDTESEHIVFKNILRLKKEAIVIYITHNVDLAKYADKILVLEEGEIVGSGSHSELYQECQVYREMFLERKME